MNPFGIVRAAVVVMYLVAQVLIFKNAVLFHTAFCFVYIGYLLLLPVESNPLVMMLAGFGLGLVMDMFYDSLGLHAMAGVLLMYLRTFWLSVITPQGGYDANASPDLTNNGTQWFLVYVAPLVFIHHAFLFFVEAGGVSFFWSTLSKTFFSTLYTAFVLVLVEFLFPGRRS
jgi:hypothetical protein